MADPIEQLEVSGEDPQKKGRELRKEQSRDTAGFDAAFVEDQKKHLDAILKARRKLDGMFKAENRNSRTTAEISSAVSLMRMELDEISQRWAAKRESLAKDPEKAIVIGNEFQKEIDDLIALYESYRKFIAKDAGRNPEHNLDLTTLRKLNRSTHKSVAQMNEILSSGHQDLIEAFKWALNQAPDDPVGERAIPTIYRYIDREFKKGNNGKMPLIWAVLAFIPADKRVNIIQGYLNGKPVNFVDQFLKVAGEKMILAVPQINNIKEDALSPEKQAELLARRAKEESEVKKFEHFMGRESYGMTNDANELINVRNILKLFAFTAASATIAGNLFVHLSQNDNWRRPKEWVKAVAKPHVVVPGMAIMAMKMQDAGKTLTEPLESKETREATAKAKAHTTLREQLIEGANAKQWKEFFAADNYNGLKLFNHYAQKLRNINGDSDFTAHSAYLQRGYFLNFLNTESKSENPLVKNVKYDKLKETFSKAMEGTSNEELADLANSSFHLALAEEATLNNALENARK